MNIITIVTICPFCGTETCIDVFSEDYKLWIEGALVQNAFPYLSADERELLVSGICPTCWEQMFGAEG